MTIEVVPPQLHALAEVLTSAADRCRLTATAVPDEAVGGPLGPPLTAFTETARTAGNCLAGELRRLAGAVTAAADAWLGVDAGVLAPRGAAVPR
ncbi:hypothetical protein [Modestobacter sp. NPDC049651]|uniref:hypothetical protein n=1 Tax=unclassified Modestobacter TaxID=2643866 RepID=UPI0033C59B95